MMKRLALAILLLPPWTGASAQSIPTQQNGLISAPGQAPRNLFPAEIGQPWGPHYVETPGEFQGFAAGKVDTLQGVLTTPSVNVDGQVRAVFGPVTATAGDPYTSPDSFAFGGQVAGVGASVTIRGQPYGYYDTGTLLSLVNTGLPLTSSRAGVNGGYEMGVSAMAADGSFDAVNLYNQTGSVAPPLVISGVTYDATHIYPPSGTSFSTTQIAALRRSQWVMTNSVDTTVSPTPAVANTVPPVTTYGSTVISWSPTSIVVAGWTVPGSGHAAAGQVPTAASPQRVTFGAPTTMFARNTVIVHDPSVAGAMSNTYRGEEVDLNDYGTVNYATNWQGLTVEYSPFGGALPSQDSWGIYAGGPLPILLKLHGSGTTVWEIDGDNFRLSPGGSPASAVGSQSILSDMFGYIDSNRGHLITRFIRDTTGTGPTSGSVHFGLRYDSTFGVSDGSGSQMGDIAWNPPGYYGGLGFCQSSTACGLAMSVSGAITLTNGLAVSAGGADITGMATFRQNIQVVGQTTLQGGYIEGANAPSSSSSACVAGQHGWDANFEYRCVSTNSWKRAALGAF